jgi:capsular exopolysaccharide synthesis family protein
MDKLQKALEKARATRQGVAPAARKAVNRLLPSASETPKDPRNGAWLALPELALDLEHMKSRRIIGHVRDAESTPYDVLRTRVREAAQREGYKRIAITSAGPQAGKSTTLANLGFSFSRLPFHKTMIFDFDLRRPAQIKLLKQSVSTDMADVINGEVPLSEHLRRYSDNLAFALAPRDVPNSAELLQSDRMKAFLDDVEATYKPDLMFFDMPPFLVADDAQGFFRHVDAVVLVIEAETTQKSQVDLIEHKLSELTNVLGVVLNKCNFPDANDAGNYKYAYGYYQEAK